MTNEQKQEIIINEIQYWKKTKLLPATYCDYLITLYTKGDGTAHLNNPSEIKVYSLEWMKILTLMIFISFAILFVFIIKIPLVYQNIFFIFGLGVSYYIVKSLNKNESVLAQFGIISFLLITLLITTSLSQNYIGIHSITNLIILLNFVGWFLISRKINRTYLLVVSILAFMLTVFYIIL